MISKRRKALHAELNAAREKFRRETEFQLRAEQTAIKIADIIGDKAYDEWIEGIDFDGLSWEEICTLLEARLKALKGDE